MTLASFADFMFIGVLSIVAAFLSFCSCRWNRTGRNAQLDGPGIVCVVQGRPWV